MNDLDRAHIDRLKETLAKKERQRRLLNKQISHLQMAIHAALKAAEAREEKANAES